MMMRELRRRATAAEQSLTQTRIQCSRRLDTLRAVAGRQPGWLLGSGFAGGFVAGLVPLGGMLRATGLTLRLATLLLTNGIAFSGRRWLASNRADAQGPSGTQ